MAPTCVNVPSLFITFMLSEAELALLVLPFACMLRHCEVWCVSMMLVLADAGAYEWCLNFFVSWLNVFALNGRHEILFIFHRMPRAFGVCVVPVCITYKMALV